MNSITVIVISCWALCGIISYLWASGGIEANNKVERFIKGLIVGTISGPILTIVIGLALAVIYTQHYYTQNREILEKKFKSLTKKNE